MDGRSDREGRRAVGHGAKQTQCGTPTDVYINKLADALIATITLCHHLEETSDGKFLLRKRSQDCKILATGW